MTELPEEVKIFLLESYENLDRVEQDFLVLEKNPSDLDLLNRIFRVIHTIKGNSGFLGFSQLEVLCHRGETLLDRLRSGVIKAAPEIISVLLEFNDQVRLILNDIETSGAEHQYNHVALLSRLQAFM